MKILVAEDDSLTRKVLQKTLHKAGFNVILAKNAKEAIAGFEQSKPEIILIDIYMPGMDGIKLIRLIRDLNINIPVAVITRDKSEEMVVKAFEAGADDFILKPFDEQDLTERLLKLRAKNE